MTEPMPPVEPRTRDNVTTERVFVPRITIKFCTQCKWMLRAAYFAQELLSTFNTDLGEVALIPTTGGVFTVTMYHSSSSPADDDTTTTTTTTTNETVIWDRKTNGGFPEVKHLKSLVRNIIDPSRDLGHTDRALRAANVPAQTQTQTRTESGASQDVNPRAAAPAEKCEDCLVLSSALAGLQAPDRLQSDTRKAIGTYSWDSVVELDYPQAFQEALAKVLDGTRTFRYVYLGGAFTEPDQEKPLWLFATGRRVRGLAQTWSLEFGDQNPSVETYVVRLAAVLGRDGWAVLGCLFLTVRVDELAVVMVDLAVNGGQQQEVRNQTIAERGSELLHGQTHA